MVTVLRVGLASMLVPIGALAIFFASYAALYPAFWLTEVSLAAKAFQAGTLLLAVATAAILWSRERVARHLVASALLLVAGMAVIACLVPAALVPLGRF